jgi:hypothetical protein
MERPKIKRTLTQKYDIHQLHSLQEVENRFLRNVADIYGIEDPDDLPVIVDVLEVFHMKLGERRAHVTDQLKDAPGSCAVAIDSLLTELEALETPGGTGK